jgi:hypothetical protein
MPWELVWEWGWNPTVLDLSTRGRWVGSFTPRLMYSRRNSPRYPLVRKLAGNQSRFGVCAIEESVLLLLGIASAAQPMAPFSLYSRGMLLIQLLNSIGLYTLYYGTPLLICPILRVDANAIAKTTFVKCQYHVVSQRVILPPTFSRPTCPGVRPTGTRDQLFFPFSLKLSLDRCRCVNLGRPLWREVGSVTYSCCWASPSQRSSKLLYDWRSVSQYGLVSSTLVGLATCRNVAVWNLRSCFVERSLWREDESAICSVITQWSESRRTRNRTLLSHQRPPQPGGPCSRIYIPQEQGGPIIPTGTGFPLRRLLRLAGLRWRYSNPPPNL